MFDIIFNTNLVSNKVAGVNEWREFSAQMKSCKLVDSASNMMHLRRNYTEKLS